MATAQATSEPALGFPQKGALRRFAFPRLVREIARGKVTGSLYLLNGQTKKVVFFEEGQPVFVRSNVLAECLGQVLSTEGLITQEQCEQTLEAIRRTGKKQGELLVEMGILSEGNLRYGLAAQLRTKLYDIFAWDDGRYQFKSDPPNNQFGVRLDLRPEGVIIGAIQDRYSEERAEKALEPSFGKYLVSSEDAPLDLGELDLLPEERYFVECVDGTRTVADCIADEVAELVPTPRALVYGLLQSGVVELSEAALEARPRPAQPDFEARPADDALAPAFEAQDVVTEYEDTPLPGELPKVRGLLGDHEDDFADVEALETGTGISPIPVEPGGNAGVPAAVQPQVSEELVAAEPAAEPDQVEETFDDIDLSEEPSGEKRLDEVVPEPVAEEPAPVPSPQPEPQPEPDAVDLSDIDELDDLSDFEEIEEVEEVEEIDVVEEVEPEALEPEALAEPEPLDVDATVDDGAPALAADASQDHDPGMTSPEMVMVDAPESPTYPDLGDIGSDLEDEAPLDDVAADDDLMLDGGDDLMPLDDLDGLDLSDGDLEPDVDLSLDDDLAIDDDLALDPNAPLDDDAAASDGGNDDLMDLDELDDIDLGGEGGSASYSGPEATFQEDQDPEMVGAMRFNEAETALNQQQFPEAVALLESAYENGFDVAELHAMLAYSRFMAAGQDFETGQHAFELLDYAESMDPSLDLVHAYRGSIHNALGDLQRARESLGRALELNPYCELAMQLMDQLG
ncbi:MAG: DUF4388 domain-containing protein [Myxococcota bacterium]